ncbi:MAG: magnesium transporter CorA family protein [Fastidiosipilaceae bacterium]|nr:magnesium transporter CorA family protein [Clostridiaceae bacterium]
MLEIFKTINNTVERLDEIEPGCWINMVDPTRDELEYVEETTQVQPDFLRAALDEEESSRTETEMGQTLVIVDIPFADSNGEIAMYTTIPLGLIAMKDYFFTVCLEDDTFLDDFKSNRVKNFFTQFKTRFILQILYRNATKYLQYLRQIEKASNRLEEQIFKSQKNRELMQMLRLEKSLVYFSTSLRANAVVLEQLMRSSNIKNYPEDQDILEDVIIENKQAIEMSNIYSSILTSTTEAFASIVSNNQNNVMKVLTSVTLVMVIPEIMAGLFGMNVKLPLTELPYAFWVIIIMIIVFCVLLIILLNKNDMF